jgi:hypothetical protein
LIETTISNAFENILTIYQYEGTNKRTNQTTKSNASGQQGYNKATPIEG